MSEIPTAYLTPGDLRDELGLGLSTVYRGLESGEIPGTKVCNRWRTLRSQLEERVHDSRVPKPRAAVDPMPSPRRVRSDSFRSKVIELETRRRSA